MKLFITGGAGFIGSNFIRYWLAHHPEDDVVNYDLLTYAGNLENLKDIEGHPRYQFVKGDVCDRDAVAAAMGDADCVIHFAAETLVDRSILNSSDFIRTNVMGTQVLLEVAKEFGTRFHHVSTDEVFGHLGPHDPPFTEQTPYAPRSPYAASKAAADHLVRAYHTKYGLPVTISNCSNNYGPNMFPEKMLPLFISNLLEGKRVPVYGDGLQIRDWIHVDDHSRGVEAIVQKGTIGETYCLGGHGEMTNLELTKKLLTLLNLDESFIEFVKDRPGHDRRYAIDFSKAKQELGWEPTVTFEKGLRAMIEWYKENQDWVSRCKSGEYQAYYKKQYQS